jgi:hypothetical protein
LNIGDIDKGMSVLHKCDNRRCVRPDHMFLGTQKDNVLDMRKKGRNRWLRGSNNKSAKLDEEAVSDIRILYELPEFNSYRRIGAMYGITTRAVVCIIKRINWKHVK